MNQTMSMIENEEAGEKLNLSASEQALNNLELFNKSIERQQEPGTGGAAAAGTALGSLECCMIDQLKEHIILRKIDSGGGGNKVNKFRRRRSLRVSSELGSPKNTLSSRHPNEKTISAARSHTRLFSQDYDNNNNNNNRNYNLDEDDSSSLATTTSEVNSEDDAASIASRLSQIVVQEEGKLGGFSPPATGLLASNSINYRQQQFLGDKMTQLKSQAVKRSDVGAEAGAGDGGVGDYLGKKKNKKQITHTRHKSLEHSLDNKAAEQVEVELIDDTDEQERDNQSQQQQKQQLQSADTDRSSNSLSRSIDQGSLPEIYVIKDDLDDGHDELTKFDNYKPQSIKQKIAHFNRGGAGKRSPTGPVKRSSNTNISQLNSRTHQTQIVKSQPLNANDIIHRECVEDDGDSGGGGGGGDVSDNVLKETSSNMKRNESCSFLPERGDLRKLGSARRNSAATMFFRSQQQLNMATTTTTTSIASPRSTTPDSQPIIAMDDKQQQQQPQQDQTNSQKWNMDTWNRVRSNSTARTVESNRDELILNIRRSTWTLPDFDQAFNKLNGGGSGSGAGSPIDKSLESVPNIPLDKSSLISSDSNELNNIQQNNYIENNINHASGNSTSLLILASKNACNQQQQQQQQQQLQQQQQFSADGSLVSALNSVERATGGASVVGCARANQENSLAQLSVNPTQIGDSYRRPSFAPSVASIISSVDSFNVSSFKNNNNKKKKHPKVKSLSKGAIHGNWDISDDDLYGIRKRKVTPTSDGIGVGWVDEKNPNKNDKENNEDEPTDEGCCCGVRKYCNLNKVRNCFPILHWLPVYTMSNLWGDLTGGIACAVLNISTSMSAAVVAGTDFGVAFRSSIVNTFVYSILCSSRHSSFGSWSIMSQMLLVSVRLALSDELILARLNVGPSAQWKPEEYERWRLNIIIMYTFLIGVFQLVCGLLNLGNILASFIPEALCSSMITATAITMAVGQLANMCGTSNKILWSIERNTTELWADLKNPPVDITDLFAGLFRWIKQIALLIKYNEQINLVCVIISISTVTLLYVNQYIVQKQLERSFKRKIFIPSEMIILVVMIIISNVMNLDEDYNVTTSGPIEVNFMIPNLPNLKLVRELWFDSVATALISYTMVYVMAKTYSNKFNYEIDCNQELIACGAGNLIGGLFDALPATASFTRTAGQVDAGAQTQMASIINCLLLVVLAQSLGPYVAALPVCVMAATLFFGFVKMMSRFSEVFMYWRVCKVDFSIWIVTFIAILSLDIVNGFVYGFIFSILTMLYRAQNRRCYMLGSIGTSDVYVPLVKYPLAEEINGIKIFQFCGPLHYVCADLFERLLRHKTRVDVKQIVQYMIDQEVVSFNPTDLNLPTHIILDFSMISYIDSAGIHTIKKIIEDYQRVNITILLASLASHVAAVVKSEPSLWNVYKNRFYVTLTDAVHCASRDSRLLMNRDQPMKVLVC